MQLSFNPSDPSPKPSEPKADLPGYVPSEEEIEISAQLRSRELLLLERALQRGQMSFDYKIGSEVEYVLIDSEGRPAPIARYLKSQVLGEGFDSELSVYNLESGSIPADFGPRCLRDLKDQSAAWLLRTRLLAADCNAKALLTGILPSYEYSDFSGDRFATQRYRDINATLRSRREGDFQFDLGDDPALRFAHPSILIESLNTSFQFHISAPPHQIVDLYNTLQLLTAPVLAVACNSPLVFGRVSHYHEARIPIWEQATDPRRVPFGDDWVSHPLQTLYELERYEPLLVDRDLVERHREGAISDQDLQDLPTLALQNGTLWRWNRICFGRDDGKYHLRVEVRALPAGPTVTDMVANSALLLGASIGLMNNLQRTYGSMGVHNLIGFKEVKENFRAATRSGLGAKFEWLGGVASAAEVCRKLIPLADAGLQQIGIPFEERRNYLGIINGRIDTGQTGAEWILRSFERSGSDKQAIPQIVMAMERNQNEDTPVHLWPLA